VRRLTRQDGVATVEVAFLLPVLLLLSVVAVEFGFAFVDWSATTNATRTAARVVSAAGDKPGADGIVLIPAVVEAMKDAPRATVVSIEVFNVNSGASNVYTSPGWACFPCNFDEMNRDTQLGSLDTIGVRIRFTHDWVVDFWSGTNPTWSDTQIVRLEPDFGGN